MFKFFRKYEKLMLAIFVIVLMVVFLIQPSLSFLTPKPENQVIGHIGQQTIAAGEERLARLDVDLLPRLYFHGIISSPSDEDEARVLTSIRERLSAVILEIAPDTTNPLALISPNAGETPAQRVRLRERTDPLRWLLILHDAQRLGLDVSDQSVAEMLGALGFGEEDKKDDAGNVVGKTTMEEKLDAFIAAHGYGFRAEDIRHALRDWGIVQQYQDLMCGYEIVPPAERLRYYVRAADEVVQAEFTQIRAIKEDLRNGDIDKAKIDQFIAGRQERAYAISLFNSTRNKLRMSAPLLAHVLEDNRATVTVEIVPVSWRKYRDAVEKLTPEEIKPTTDKLFQTYQNTLPKQGQPYPFGYRFADRVQLEYLKFPIDALRTTVQVDGVDAWHRFLDHREDYRAAYERKLAAPTTAPATQATTGPASRPALAAAPATAPATQPASDEQVFTEMLPNIIEELKADRAQAECARLVKEAQSMLGEPERRLEERDSYKIVPPAAQWQPEAAATQPAAGAPGLHANSMAQVRDYARFSICEYRVSRNWVNVDQLKDKFPDIGAAVLLQARDREPAPLAAYVASAHELNPPPENRLLKERLQRGIVSQPLIDRDHSMYLFRLIDAQPAHSPKDVDEVRDAVERDARRLLGYQRLQKEDLTRLDGAVKHTEKFEDLQKEADAEDRAIGVLRPDPFSRRAVADGRLVTPNVLGAQESPGFVDAVFKLADAAQEGAGLLVSLGSLPPSQRSQAIPADDALAICLTRVREYQRLPRSEYNAMAATDQATPVPAQVNNLLLRAPDEPDPLSLEALKARLKFVEEGKVKAAPAQ